MNLYSWVGKHDHIVSDKKTCYFKLNNIDYLFTFKSNSYRCKVIQDNKVLLEFKDILNNKITLNDKTFKDPKYFGDFTNFKRIISNKEYIIRNGEQILFTKKFIPLLTF